LAVAPELAFAYMENGDLERARFIWRQIEFGGDSLDVDLARKMIRVIEADDMKDFPESDVQSLFSLLAYRHMDLDKLSELIVSFSNQDIQAMAILRLFNIYLELGQYEKALLMLEQLGQLTVSNGDVVEDINLAQCKYAYHTNDKDMQQRLFSEMKSDHLPVNDYLNLFRAMSKSESMGSTEVANDIEQIGYNNPFFEHGVLAAADFFNVKVNDPDKAYDILLNSVNLNPFSFELNKAYALQCIRVGLTNYAFDTMEELNSLMPSAMFKTFENEFHRLLNEIESKSSVW